MNLRYTCAGIYMHKEGFPVLLSCYLPSIVKQQFVTFALKSQSLNTIALLVSYYYIIILYYIIPMSRS